MVGRARRVNRRDEHLHAMQFRPALAAQVERVQPAQRLSPSDRGCPLDTARARCLWHVGGTAGTNHDLAPDGDGSSLAAG
jgi:hypothetical protein